MGFVSAHSAVFHADFGHSSELDIVKKASLNIPNSKTCFFLKVVRQDQKYVRLDGIFRSSIWILLKRRRERLLLYNSAIASFYFLQAGKSCHCRASNGASDFKSNPNMYGTLI